MKHFYRNNAHWIGPFVYILALYAALLLACNSITDFVWLSGAMQIVALLALCLHYPKPTPQSDPPINRSQYGEVLYLGEWRRCWISEWAPGDSSRHVAIIIDGRRKEVSPNDVRLRKE